MEAVREVQVGQGDGVCNRSRGALQDEHAGKRTIPYEDRLETFVWEVRSMLAERPRYLLILAGGTDVQGGARSARA